MSAERRGALPILLYHGIGSGPGSSRFDVSLDAFRRQMDLVAACERRTLTISELVHTLRRPHAELHPALAVTFDDGTADFHDQAWPALRERGIAVTLYVTAGLVGMRHEGKEMLSWEQLAELRDAGVEIGAHGYDHVALDVLPLHRAALELVNSKLELERRLGIRVTSFAYPFGYHTGALERLLRRAGYTSACAVKNRLSHPGDDRYALARLTITADTSARRFERLLRGRGASRSWQGERLRTRAWRAYRYARAVT